MIHSRSEEYMPEEAIYLPVVSFDSVLKKKKIPAGLAVMTPQGQF